MINTENKDHFRRTQRDYSLAFKLQVVDEVEKGHLTWMQARRKYGIQGKTTVLVWTYTDKLGKKVYGNFTRSYDTKKKQLIMEVAFLNKLPSWVEGQSPELVPGKGVPTQAHITMYQMKKLGIGFGEVESVKMSTIQNAETICNIEWIIRNYGESRINEFAFQTFSVQYAETPLIQSGTKITDTKVDLKSPETKYSAIDDMLRYYEAKDPDLIPKHNEILKRYGVNRTDKVNWNFDIYLDTEPIK